MIGALIYINLVRNRTDCKVGSVAGYDQQIRHGILLKKDLEVAEFTAINIAVLPNCRHLSLSDVVSRRAIQDRRMLSVATEREETKEPGTFGI